VEAAREIKTKLEIPVVYLSAYSDNRILERAKTTEPFGYIIKPFDEKDLYSSIEVALHRHRKQKENM
jgi:AmiR/NasT family two-component response regulator